MFAFVPLGVFGPRVVFSAHFDVNAPRNIPGLKNPTRACVGRK